MAEIIALWIACTKIGVLARARGLRAQPLQTRAVFLWFLFEILGAFAGALLGLSGILLYIAALGGALFSLKVSFSFARAGEVGKANADRDSFDDFAFARVTIDAVRKKEDESAGQPTDPNPL